MDINLNGNTLTNGYFAGIVTGPAPIPPFPLGLPYAVPTYVGNSETAPLINCVCTGDSITQGPVTLGSTPNSFPLFLSALGFGANLNIWNAGLSGYTAIQLATIFNTSQTYDGLPNSGTYNALSKLGAGTFFIEGAGTNDLSAICAQINQVSTTGNTNGTNIITGLGTTTGVPSSGGYVIANWQGTLTSNGTNPSDGDLIVIGSRTYRLKNTPAAFNDILIGVNAAATIANILDVLAFANTPGVQWFPGTPVNIEVNPIGTTSTTLTIRGYNPFLSTGLITTTTSAHLSWGAATLTGGGVIPSGTTVTSVDSSSQVHISANATGSVTGANIAFATETVAQWKTAEQSMWTAARTAGAQIVRWSILPRSDTIPAYINNTLAAVTWTAMNTWLAAQQYNGTSVTSGWDAYADLSKYPEFNNILNASVWVQGGAGNKGIHPNYASMHLLTAAINDAGLSLLSGANTVAFNPFSYQGIPNSWLQPDVARMDVVGSWTASQTMTTETVGAPALILQTGALNTYALDLFSAFNTGRHIQFDHGASGSINAGTDYFQIQPPSGVVAQVAGALQVGVGAGSPGLYIFGNTPSSGYGMGVNPFNVDFFTQGSFAWDVGFNTSPSAGGSLLFLDSTGNLTVKTSLTSPSISSSGNIVLSAAGKTLSLKGGSNALSGTVTLTAGLGTITSSAITASTVIILTLKAASGANSYPQVQVAAGSATVTGLSTDAGTYNWAALLANQ